MSNCVAEHRMGTFCVSQRIVKDNPQAVMDMLLGMVIVKCEPAVGANPLVMDLRYWAYSDVFEPLSQCDEIPAFIPVFNADGTFKALEKINPPDHVAKIRELQRTLRDCMMLLAKAPLSDEAENRVDVQKVLDFLERHKDAYADPS